MNVLLSIKPKYVDKIKLGTKRYEFRKILFSKKKITNIKEVYIYSSSPMKKIVAKFVIEEIIEDHPKKLWDKCKNWSGMDEISFFKYFNNNKRGFAIKISKPKFFNIPIDPKTIIQNFVPPQSFCYVNVINSRLILNKV